MSLESAIAMIGMKSEDNTNSDPVKGVGTTIQRLDKEWQITAKQQNTPIQ